MQNQQPTKEIKKIHYHVFHNSDGSYIMDMARESKSELQIGDIFPIIRGWIEKSNYETLTPCRVTWMQEVPSQPGVFSIYVEPVQELNQKPRSSWTRPSNGFKLDDEGYDGWLQGKTNE